MKSYLTALEYCPTVSALAALPLAHSRLARLNCRGEATVFLLSRSHATDINMGRQNS